MFKHIVSFVLYSLVLQGITSPTSSGPQTSTAEVLNQFTNSLNLESESVATQFTHYAQSIDYFVKRGSYAIADSLIEITDNLVSPEFDSTLIIDYKKTKAFLYKLNFQYEKSLTLYLEILKFYTDKNDLENICFTKASLSEFYRAEGNIELFIKYAYEALELTKKHPISESTVSFVFSRMASLQSFYNSDSVLFYSEKALALALASGNSYVAALSQTELGYYSMHISPNDTSKSLTYYRDAIKNYESEDRFRDILSVTENISRNYYYAQNHKEAIRVLDDIIPRAIENGWKDYLDQVYYILAMSHNALGNKEEVQKFTLLAIAATEDKAFVQNALKVDQLAISFEKDLTENELNEVKQQVEFNAQLFQYVFIFTIIILIALIMSGYLFIRVRKKNALLNLQQITIKEKNLALEESVEEKEVLYKELNHRVKNNLMVLSSLIYLQQENEVHKTPEKDSLFDSLKYRIQSMAIVHKKLYGSDGATSVNLSSYIEELALLIVTSSVQNIEEIPIRIESDQIMLLLSEAIPLALILNELITNTVKHVNEKNLREGIDFKCSKSGKMLHMHYQDYGNGLPTGYKLDSYNSMGMKIIILMTRQLKGTYEIPESKNGFSIHFSIPFSK